MSGSTARPGGASSGAQVSSPSSLTGAALTALATAASLTACGTQVPDVPPGQTVSYSTHLEPLVIARCLGCHEVDEPEADLVLERGRDVPKAVHFSTSAYQDILGHVQALQTAMSACCAPGILL